MNPTRTHTIPAPLRRTAALLAAALLFALSPAPARAALAVAAPSAALMEKETGALLFEQNAHEAREPASITKIMTLLLVMEAIDSGALSYEDTVTASAYAASMGGSQIWLREGETMTVDELLKAVCIVSGNDASVALAEHLAGSEDAFVERMNRRAQELGMNDTHFCNCNGLPAEGHVTSAYDIAVLSRELILHHGDIRRYTTVRLDSLRGGESMLVNTNKLLTTFDGITGLKTGSTDAARYCVSATAERGGMELIAVVLGGETSESRFADAASLLNYGFARWTLMTLTPDEALPTLPVALGARGSVQTVLTEENRLLLERERAAGLCKTVELPLQVDAPVACGDVLGSLVVTAADGGELARLPILAGEDVPRVTLWEMTLRFLRAGFCLR